MAGLPHLSCWGRVYCYGISGERQRRRPWRRYPLPSIP